MATDLTIQVNGVKEAVKYLNQVEPGYRKAYVANMKEIAKPMTEAMKSNYDDARFFREAQGGLGGQGAAVVVAVGQQDHRFGLGLRGLQP